MNESLTPTEAKAIKNSSDRPGMRLSIYLPQPLADDFRHTVPKISRAVVIRRLLLALMRLIEDSGKESYIKLIFGEFKLSTEDATVTINAGEGLMEEQEL